MRNFLLGFLFTFVSVANVWAVECGAGYYPNESGTCSACDAGYYCLGGGEKYFGGYENNRYLQVEYIETSNDALINTGLHLSYDGYTANTKMMLNKLSVIFGSYYGSSPIYQRYYIGFIEQNRFEISWFNKYARYYNWNIIDGNPHEFEIILTNGTQKLLMDGEVYGSQGYTVNASSIRTQYEVPIARNVVIYYMQIYHGTTGEMLRDFVPVYDTVNKAYGMYDKLNNIFYGNGKGTVTGFVWADASGPGYITGPVADSGLHPCDIGTYSTGGATKCSPCTNAPTNATYTGNAKSNSCPWECNSGYIATSIGTCAQICDSSVVKYLNTSTGIKIPLYNTKQTTPALVIEYNNKKCYGNLVAGEISNSLIININGTKYHAVN